MKPGSFVLALKTARQFGARQAGWYAFYQAGLRSGLWRALTPARNYDQLDLAIQPVFNLPDPTTLKRLLGNDADALLAEAGEIVSGRFRPYGAGSAPLELAPPGPLRHWSAAERHLPAGVDIKDLWEPARFGWAFTLGRAYRLSSDEQYAGAFWQQFEVFVEVNPPNQGLHWSSAQETALRMAALVFAGQVFAGSAHSTPERLRLLAGVLAAHARRIPPTLSYARAQHNNHLLSEGLGLLLAGTALPTHPQAAGWRRLGRLTLIDGLRRQIQPDGVYAQHSLNYHRLMLHIALLASAQGRQVFPPDVQTRLAAATRWLWAQVDASTGEAPNYGHNDGANLLSFAARYGDQRPSVQAAARAFLGQAVLPPGPWDELSLWLGSGEETDRAAISRPASPAIHRLGDETAWGVLRAEHYTSRPAHADQLHVDLWWQGQPITLDAGTYRYNAAPPWENALAGSAVHNTVTIQGQDQMQRTGRFRWLDWAQARLLTASAGQQVAEHNGYTRLGVRHRRSLAQVKTEHWRIGDEITTTRSTAAVYTIRLHWLFPDAPYQLDEAENSLSLDLPAGQVRLRLTIDARPAAPVGLTLVRAGQYLAGSGAEDPVRGWFSPTYSIRQPALSLALTVQAALPVRLTSEFWLLPK